MYAVTKGAGGVPSIHAFAFWALLLLVVPSISAGLTRDATAKEGFFATGAAMLRFALLGGRYVPYLAFFLGFALFTWIQQFFLPRTTFPLNVAVLATLGTSAAVVLLYLAISAPARRAALALVAVVGALDVVALLLIHVGVTTGLGDHAVFRPLLLVATGVTSWVGVWVAGGLGRTRVSHGARP